MPVIVNGIFRTYANSLIVNKTVFLPRFHRNTVAEEDFPDLLALKEDEAKVEQIYQSFGYKTVFINTDELIAHGGGIHCVTSQLPKNSTKEFTKL